VKKGRINLMSKVQVVQNKLDAMLLRRRQYHSDRLVMYFALVLSEGLECISKPVKEEVSCRVILPPSF